ncbi:membrane progestin receptor beta-like [Lineus longissimus]|uniref:membrane progestin receptor beta-like n=1 Tax=Lineus longissimus TaxID=88925 RepID=UPI002B4E9D27
MTLKRQVIFPTHSDTVTCDDVSHSFTNIGILTGYRPSGKSWSYYLRSIFHLHNETFNVWTHLIGMLFLACLTTYHGITTVYDEPGVTSSIWLHGICCILIQVMSTLTHLLRSKSRMVNECVYFFDYSGISFANFGTHVLLFHHCYDRRWINLLGPHALIFSVVISASVNAAMCYCRAIVKPNYTNCYKIFNLVPNLVSLMFGIGPLVARINFPDATAAQLPDQNLESFVCRLLHLSNLLFITTGSFYGSHIPERFSPGSFDIFGHSHMMVHIFITATFAVQQIAAYYDIPVQYVTKDMRETISSYGSIWFYFSILVVLNSAIVVHCITIVLRKEKKLAKSM